jgi:hypothetical protein
VAAPLSASYVYALVAGAKPRLKKAPALPGGGKPRLVDAGQGLHALIASVPLELYDAEAIERGLRDLEWVSRCAIAHERAIESVSGALAVLPMKLFTIFHSEERALAHVARTRKKIESLVRRLAGKVELGARVALDPTRAVKTAPRPKTGASFLARKKEQRDAGRDLVKNGAELAHAFHERLARLADDATKRPPAAPRLVLDAAYLVARDEEAAFKKAFAKEARALEARGLDATLTGPWPPYHFAGLA